MRHVRPIRSILNIHVFSSRQFWLIPPYSINPSVQHFMLLSRSAWYQQKWALSRSTILCSLLNRQALTYLSASKTIYLTAHLICKHASCTSFLHVQIVLPASRAMHIYPDMHSIILLRLDEYEPHDFRKFGIEQSICILLVFLNIFRSPCVVHRSKHNMWHDQEEWVGCRGCCFWDIGKNSVQIPLFHIVFSIVKSFITQ